MMGGLAEQVLAEKAERDAARERFETRLARLKGELDERGFASRVASKVAEDAKDVFEEARDVADQNRGIVAGTIVALMVWFMRNPILAALGRWIGEHNQDKMEAHDERR